LNSFFPSSVVYIQEVLKSNLSYPLFNRKGGGKIQPLIPLFYLSYSFVPVKNREIINGEHMVTELAEFGINAARLKDDFNFV